MIHFGSICPYCIEYKTFLIIDSEHIPSIEVVQCFIVHHVPYYYNIFSFSYS